MQYDFGDLIINTSLFFMLFFVFFVCHGMFWDYIHKEEDAPFSLSMLVGSLGIAMGAILSVWLVLAVLVLLFSIFIGAPVDSYALRLSLLSLQTIQFASILALPAAVVTLFTHRKTAKDIRVETVSSISCKKKVRVKREDGSLYLPENKHIK